MNRRLVVVLAAIAASLAVPGAAHACSTDNVGWFETFPDASCLLTQTDTEVDALGGLRLTTTGTPQQATWDTTADFDPAAAPTPDPLRPAVGLRTLAIDETGADTLELPATRLPLARAATGEPVIEASPSARIDSDHVEDPSILKDGSTYVLYFTGAPEDGRAPAIFRATSTDGASWTKVDGDTTDPDFDPVIAPSSEAGAFDVNGAFGADVVLDPDDEEAPYKMWYSGRGPLYTTIGYATSVDGLEWTKHDADPEGDETPDGVADAVLTTGLNGSRDAFAAAHPSVIRDGSVWKMWYEGDDSNQRSIAYATSLDGVSWAKGGAVLTPGTSEHTEFGALAPTVWKDGDTFRMVLGGRKEISSGTGTFQVKLVETDSSNGTTWAAPTVAMNQSQTVSGTTDLSSPDMLVDTGAPANADHKLFFAGRRDGHFYVDRVNDGDGVGFSGGQNALTPEGIGTPGPLDARAASGLSVAEPGGTPDVLVGAYTGRGRDLVLSLGIATSLDGLAWDKDAADDGSPDPVISRGGNVDDDGQSDPSLVYAQDTSSPNADDWFVFYTALDAGVRRIAMASADEAETTLLPGAWAGKAVELAGDGTGFDATGVSHPSVVEDAGTFLMFYTGHGATGTGIGRATATTVDGTYTRASAAAGADEGLVSIGADAGCAPDGRRDPVVLRAGAGDLRMLYTGIERLNLDSDPATIERTVERACYATSTDGGETWTAHGVVLNPSQQPHAFDEAGVAASGMLARDTDETAGDDTLYVYTDGTDRFGRHRGGLATTDLPTPADATGVIPHGWATYQLGPLPSGRDFQRVERLSTGQDAELWMSVLQPYSSDQKQYWSDFFPVTEDAAEQALNFQLGVKGVRWQVRLRDGSAGVEASRPALDSVVIDHADVQFAATGSATTTEIAPPQDFALQSWTALTLNTSLFSPLGGGTGTGSVTVLGTGDAPVAGPTPLTVSGTDQTISLASVDAAANPKLKLRFDLASGDTRQASPKIDSAKVTYAAVEPGATPTPAPTPVPTPVPTVAPPPPPPPPPVVLTLSAAPVKVVYGRRVTLSGTLTQGAAGLLGRAVTVTAQPLGAAAPKPAGTVSTLAAGAWTFAVRPRKHTVYAASSAGATPPAAVAVTVKHRVGLKVRLRGRRATFSGSIGPRHRRRAVTIQRKAGRRWRKVVTVKTNRRSRFKVTRRLPKGRQRLRAVTRADKSHAAGRSRARRVRVR